MTKLEKSIRSAMRPYGLDLRNGHIVVQGKNPGHIMKRGVDRMLSHAYAEVENGVVADIRFYFEQEARLACDYNGETLEITDEIVEWYGGYETWDDLIQRIVRRVKNKMEAGEQKEEPMSIAEIRAISGFKKTQFAKRYRIPYRTWQNWELGITPCPEYIRLLLARAVREDFK